MSNPVTRITIETDDRASSSIRRIAMELGGLGSKAEAVGPRSKAGTDALAGSLERLAMQVAAAASGYKALELAASFTQRGFAFNAEWEQSRIGIGSVIAAVNTLTDAQGRTLEGMEKYTVAQGLAEESMRKIQVMGLQTTATTDQLVEGFQALIGPAAAVGMTLDQTADYTLQMVQALGALGIPLNQLSAEARSLLDGTINKTQDRLAGALDITGDMVKSWKSQGILVEELNKRLASFKLAGKDVADTWAGLSSNMKDAIGFLSGQTGRGVFEGVKQSYRELLGELVDAENLRAGDGIGNIVDALTRLNTMLGGGVVTLTREFIDRLHELNDPQTLQSIETTLGNVAHTGQTALTVLGGVGSAIGNTLSTALDGWNSLPEPIREAGLIGGLLLGKKGMVAMTVLSYAAGIGDRLDRAINEINKGTMGWGDLLGNAEQIESKIAAAHDPTNAQANLERMRAKQRGYMRGSAGWKAMQENIDRAELEYSVRGWKSQYGDLSARDKAMDAAFRKPAGITVKGTPRAPDTKGIAKVESAIESITERLARYGDTGTEGQGRMARLSKEYDGFAKVLGQTNPQVRAFADVMAYAKQHNGYTPEEVAKSTRAVELETEALRDKAAAIQGATRDDGTIDQRTLALLNATASADREYRADVLKGVDDAVAAKKRDLSVSAAQANVDQENLQVKIAFYDELAQLYRNDEALQMRSLNKRLEDLRASGVAEVDILRWLERKRLDAATDAYSGMKRAALDYHQEATNAASNWQRFSGSVFSTSEDAITSMCTTGKFKFSDMIDSWLADFTRLAVRQNVTGPLAGALGSINFGQILGFGNHDGGLAGYEASFARAVPAGMFVGAPRYHTGGIIGPDEVPAILRKGEGVFTPEQMRALSPSGSASPSKIEINLFNESGQPIQRATSQAEVQGDKYVIGIWLKGWQNNTMGIRDAVAGA